MRQKIFEIYDRIDLGAIGHPGDIERLRMAAIELASTEGFTRSSGDVSLRRLAQYSLSPVMKAAFEQVYGPPYLARLLFAEVGARPKEDLFLRVEYVERSRPMRGRFRNTAKLRSAEGDRQSSELMETFLKGAALSDPIWARQLTRSQCLECGAYDRARMAPRNAEPATDGQTFCGNSLPRPESRRQFWKEIEDSHSLSHLTDDEVRSSIRQ